MTGSTGSSPWARSGCGGPPASPCSAPGLVLDLGCGTGDTDFGSRPVIGLDPVIEMVALSPVPARVVAVGEHLPLRDDTMDGVFSAFVFRNLTSVDATLAEIERVLEPGRAAVIIDLGRPRGRILRAIHRIGTAVVLPLVGSDLRRRPEGVLVPPSVPRLPPPARGALRRPLTWFWRRSGARVCSGSSTGPCSANAPLAGEGEPEAA